MHYFNDFLAFIQPIKVIAAKSFKAKLGDGWLRIRVPSQTCKKHVDNHFFIIINEQWIGNFLQYNKYDVFCLLKKRHIRLFRNLVIDCLYVKLSFSEKKNWIIALF